MSAKKEYDALLQSGDLLELYKGLSGNWDKDRKTFTELYDLNVKAIKEIDVHYEED
jgi:hypothetical protein